MTAPAAPRTRSLLPREHGAYGQLGAPLATGLAMGRPGAAAVALALAAVATFLSHEPAVVLLGGRGPRVRTEHGARARRRLLLLGALAAVLGAVALALAGRAVWWAVGFAAGLGATAMAHVVAKVEKTLVGEVVASAALASAALPVAVAGGLDSTAAGWTWAAWALGFAAITAAVRDVIARGKRKRTPWGPLLMVAVLGAAMALAWTQVIVRAAAPLMVVALALVIAPAAPRRLRQTGWLLMAASMATATWLVVLAQT